MSGAAPAGDPARPRVLCVDDEPMVLEGLRLHLRRRFAFHAATRGAEALALVEAGPPFAVVVTDMRMPEMDGVEFLTRLRVASPDSVRILLTGYADFNSAVAAVNDGQVFRFLVKPSTPEATVQAVSAAARQYRLLRAERELLGETLTGAVRALTGVLAMAHPVAFGRAERLARTVGRLCDRLGVADRWAIEVAAELSQIGCIRLPPALAEKLYFGRPLLPAEQALADRVPGIADDLLARIPRLEPVRAILAAQGWRWDGQGRPPGAEPGEQPLGARLLRLAVDLDTLESSGLSTAEVLSVLRARGGAYDPVVLAALAEELGRQDAGVVQEVALADLRPGLILAGDLWSRTGLLLVARGHVVTEGIVQRLQATGLAVVEPIRVQAAPR